MTLKDWFYCSSTSTDTQHTTLHSSQWAQPGDPPTSTQQEWQLCRPPFFNGTLPLIYWSWGMHHLLWSYWFLSTCHLTPSATVGGGMGLRWCKKGEHRVHQSPSVVVHWHLHCKKCPSLLALWSVVEYIFSLEKCNMQNWQMTQFRYWLRTKTKKKRKKISIWNQGM